MKTIRILAALAAALPAITASAAERLTITLQHDLDIARPSETVTVPWSEVNKARRTSASLMAS